MSDDLRWTDVGAETDWPGDGGRVVQVGARRISVYRHDGGWYAIKDVCPHAGVSLAKGPARAGTVMCVGHGWVFSLKTGDIISGPPGFSVATYAVRAIGGRVQIGT